MKPSIEIDNLVDEKYLIIHDVVENEDGSANVQLTIGSEGLRVLIEVGLITILKLGIKYDESVGQDVP